LTFPSLNAILISGEKYNMRTIAYTTHEQGSWEFQPRFAKNEYKIVWSKNTGTFLMKKVRELDGKVKARFVGIRGRHNMIPTHDMIIIAMEGVK
jgi:hypothetical protein